jgi:hypothetical protein
MSLVYPILVLYDGDAFICQNSCLGDPKSYVESYLSSNNLDKTNIQVYAYERKKWIALLLESKNNKLDFIIEKDKIKLLKTVEDLEEVDMDVDWAKDSELSEFYSEEEIEKINENKQILSTFSFITQEIRDSLPHQIPVKKRKVSIKVRKQVVEKEVSGVKLELT